MMADVEEAALLAIIIACPTKKKRIGAEQLFPREMMDILGISTSFCICKLCWAKKYIKLPI